MLIPARMHPSGETSLRSNGGCVRVRIPAVDLTPQLGSLLNARRGGLWESTSVQCRSMSSANTTTARLFQRTSTMRRIIWAWSTQHTKSFSMRNGDRYSFTVRFGCKR